MGQFISNLINLNIESWIILGVLVYFFVTKIIIKIPKWLKDRQIKKATVAGVSIELADGTVVDNNPHANCPHFRDILLAFQEQRSNEKEIGQIKWRLIPRDLKNVAEDCFDNIFAKMREVFFELLFKKRQEVMETTPIELRTELVNSEEAILWKNAEKIIRKELHVEIDRIIRENNFMKKEQSGNWNSYKKTKAGNLDSILNDTLNTAYRHNFPKVEEVQKEIHNKLYDQTKDFNIQKSLLGLMDEMLVELKGYWNEIERLVEENRQIMIGIFGSVKLREQKA